MKRTLVIVTMVAAVMLISSCKATPQPTTKASTSNTNAATTSTNANTTADKQNELPANDAELTIFMVADESDQSLYEHLRGRRVLWQATILSNTKVGAKDFIAVVKPGYLIMGDLKSPLKKALAKDTKVSVDGFIESKSQMAMRDPQGNPEGGAHIVNLKSVTLLDK